ncbi:MAG TPA: hypothetical protein VHB79_36315 [Polyangiaceae bacterium]|nr:hypothetical protein [Polyangiaceae bacterium]
MARGFWLVVGVLSLGCGGIVARQSGDDDDSTNGGSSSATGGSSAVPKGGSTSIPKGGAASTPVGGATSTPKGGSASVPPIDSGEGDGCFNDSDCPNPSCGGLVCNWTKMSPNPSGNKIFYCSPAGTGPQGMDGWCTTDADCKCASAGAKCVAPYCTFTRVP